MEHIVIHPHALKHGLSEEDIQYAWKNFLARRWRKAPNENQIVTIGATRKGTLLQMVGTEAQGHHIVYHALTPPTKNVLKELGLAPKKLRNLRRR